MSAFAAQWWTNKQSVFSSCEIWELLSLNREYGHDMINAFRGFRSLNEKLLNHSDRLSWDNYIEILRLLTRASNGHLPISFARRLHLKTYGAPGFAILTSPTLGEAIDTIVRFSVLLNIKFPLEFTPDGLIRLRMSTSGHVDAHFAMLLFELDIFKLHNFLEEVIPSNSIKRILRICGRETNLNDCKQLINDAWHNQGLTVITAELQIPKNKISLPLPGALTKLHRRCVAEGELLLDNLRDPFDVKFAIISRLQNLENGVPTMAEIAADLDMSERTLRRKLIKLNTSFSELRDQVRIALAEELLVGSNRSTEDVAERLGYSDAANFRHAFKRWHGEPPSFFRKKMTNSNLRAAT